MRLTGMALYLTLFVLQARLNAQQPADGTQPSGSLQDMTGTPNSNAAAGQPDKLPGAVSVAGVDGIGITIGAATDSGATATGGTSAFAGTSSSSAQGKGSAPRISDFGWVLPSGFSISASGQILGIFNTNVTQAVQDPTADTSAHYGGLLEIASVSGHTYFDSVYVPGYTQYHRFDVLDSLQQSLALRLRHEFSKRHSVSWNLNFSKLPEWGGSAFASTNYGALLSSLLGVTTQDLTATVTAARTDFNIQHRFNKRSHVTLGLNGGVSKFTTPTNNQFTTYFAQPDSNTWTGGETLAYDYDLGNHRSVGVNAANNYSFFTAQDYHDNYQNVHLHYGQSFSNGWGFDGNIGPGFTEGQNALNKFQTTVDFSVGVHKTTARTTFRAYVSNSYQAGLVPGTLSRWTGTLTAQRAINRRWLAGIFANYTGSPYPTGTSTLNQTSQELYSAGLQAGRRIQNRLTWFFNCGYSAQRGYFNDGGGLVKAEVVATGFVVDFTNAFSRGMSHARTPGAPGAGRGY